MVAFVEFVERLFRYVDGVSMRGTDSRCMVASEEFVDMVAGGKEVEGSRGEQAVRL